MVTVASTVSSGSSRNVTPSIGGRSTRRSESPIADAADVELEVLRDLHRQRLDVELAADLREDAAFLDAGRLADELDRDLRLDRLVEPDLVQIDVREPAARHFLLVVLEHGRDAASLPDDDVENRVQARVAGQRAPQLPLVHDESGAASFHARRARPARGPGCAGAANRRSRALRAP